MLGADDDSPRTRGALALIAEAVRAKGGRCRRAGRGAQADIRIEVADPAGEAEGYRLIVDEHGARIAAASPRAALWAAQTLRQLVRNEGDCVVLPHVRIDDAPDLAWRAFFEEANFASAARTLADWKCLVDRLAGLKLNALMVGLYSCWRREDHSKEFMLMPSRTYPEIRKPVRFEYLSARKRRRVVVEHLPFMYEQDFLGELITYAAANGVTIIPYFSSLGHNTLIPRVLPEVSMVDAAGRPKNYGFCTSNPRTYEVLFNLFDECIERYMRPAGLDMIGIGMDEVRDCCECAACRAAKNRGLDNFVTRHVFKLAHFLKQRGMRRVLMWHDMVERAGFMNGRFARRLRRERLDDLLAFAWWSYGDLRGGPELAVHPYPLRNLKPQLGLHQWTATCTGWNYYMPRALMTDIDTSPWTHAQIAARDGCEGTVSYAIYDPIFLMGVHALGEYTWNAAPGNDLRVFHERFGRRLFGDDWQEGLRHFRTYHRALEPWLPLLRNMFFRVYEKPQPGKALSGLDKSLADSGAFETVLALLRQSSAGLRALAERHAESRADIMVYIADTDYAAALLDVSYGVLKVVRDYYAARGEPANAALVARFRAARGELERHRARLREAMVLNERCRPAAGVQYLLDRATCLDDFVAQFFALTEKLSREFDKGDDATLPVFWSTLDGFFGRDAGIDPLG